MIPQPLGTFLFIIVGGILCLILGQKTKVPSILFLLLFGIIFGPDFADFIQPKILEPIFTSIISLLIALVLFEGGASLKFSQYREISTVLKNLLTIGALTTLAVATLAAHYLGTLPWKEALLFGSIMIVTGPTVISPILRRIRVKPHLHNILKWEGILIDPLGVLVSVVIFELLLLNEFGILRSLGAFGLRILVGTLLGFCAGWIMKIGLSKRWFLRFESEEYGGLFLLGVNITFFGLAEIIVPHTGLVTSAIAGIYIGNQDIASQKKVFHFEHQITMFSLSVLFILISSTIPTESLSKHLTEGLAVLGVLLVVGRPLAVVLSSLNEEMSFNEKLFLSSVAPRGIVSAALATIFAFSLQSEGSHSLDVFLPISFVVIMGTILFYSFISIFAGQLPNVKEEPRHGILIVGANPFALLFAKELQKRDVRVVFIDTNIRYCQKARKKNFEAYNGSGIDGEFLAALDLKGIGKMVALTPNHELNVLACQTVSQFLTPQDVFRLWDKTDTWEQAVSPSYDQSWGRPLVVSLSDEFWDLWDVVIQGLDPNTKTLSKFFKGRKFLKGWKIETHILSEPLTVTPDNLSREDLHFPFFAWTNDGLLFLYPEVAIPKDAEIIFLKP